MVLDGLDVREHRLDPALERGVEEAQYFEVAVQHDHARAESDRHLAGVEADHPTADDDHLRR